MPDSKTMKLGKRQGINLLSNLSCNVTNVYKKIALVFKSSLESTCARIYITDAMLKTCFNLVCLLKQTVRSMGTKNHKKWSFNGYFMDM